MRRGSGRVASACQSSLYLGVAQGSGSLLAAEMPVELGLREQRADLRLAAGRQQRQPVERAGKRRALDESAALAEPPGDLQLRIVEVAQEAEAMADRLAA